MRPPTETRTTPKTAPPSATPEPPTPTPSPTAALAEDASFLERPHANAVRVMTYNVNWDSIFPPLDPESHDLRTASRGMAFQRILAAVQPDVVCLQEINPARDPAQTATLLDDTLDETGKETWTATSRRDTLIASRYPVLTAGYELNVPAFPQELAQAAALIDLPDATFGAQDLYVVCAHFKASGGSYDILLRQRQADVIMAQVGDALTAGGAIDLPAQTPFVILGDFNVYTTDPANHLRTLLTGDIKNESSYGPDVAPDWDGTALADLVPNHNGLGAPDYTWRNDGSALDPGILDRIVFSDSVLVAAHGFVLNTTLMAMEALAAAELREGDVLLNPQTGLFDHLPLVADFVVDE
jgi:endonuclease/exonuclease/phosphatase family metal-dependent hydrolase